jgi:hypothetical protein
LALDEEVAVEEEEEEEEDFDLLRGGGWLFVFDLQIDFFLTLREGATDKPSAAAEEEEEGEEEGGGGGGEGEGGAPANRRFASRCRLFAIAEAELAQKGNPKAFGLRLFALLLRRTAMRRAKP